MYVVAAFEHDITLELALKDIENKGIDRKNILCIPLNKRINTEKFFDTIHRTDGKDTMNIPFILATSISLFGAIFGFRWKWGPIIWGGLGFLIGLFIGFIIMFIIYKVQKVKVKKHSLTEVIVMINCNKDKEDEVVEVLWQQYALGVAKLYK